MKELSVIFPAAVLLLAFLLGGEYIGTRREAPQGRARCFRMERNDRLLAWGIALVYAIAAFTNLGCTDAPETFLRPDNDEMIQICLPEGTVLDHVMWYSGGATGVWGVARSTDGSAWDDVSELGASYTTVFRWNSTVFEQILPSTHIGLWVSSGSPMLGEIALYDMEGQLVAPTWVDPAGEALFDEQELIPAESDYRNSTYFDEIYHARTAWEGLHGEPIYEVTHPPLGKLILSLGILLFGMCPFGWRFSGTLFGVLMLPLLYAFLKRLFGKRYIAGCGTVIFAADFMHFTQTRIATIDTYAVFFILLMYYLMYCWLTETDGRTARRCLALCGVSFGLGAASKWTCLYAGAGLGVIWLVRWLRSGKFAGREFWRSVGFCLIFFVAVPALIYYLSYFPYGRAAGMRWPAMIFSRDYVRLVLDNQRYMWSYHSGLVATHPYSSRWWQWVLDIRPILYYLNYTDGGASRSAITAFTSPMLCWGGLIAMLVCFCEAIVHRSKRAAFISVGYLAQMLPWVAVTRLTFAYHYFPSEIFLVLALGFVFDGLDERGRQRWLMYAVTAASVVLFAGFYPVLSGKAVSVGFCKNYLQWLGSWPI